jgi:hypothetical protein
MSFDLARISSKRKTCGAVIRAVDARVTSGLGIYKLRLHMCTDILQSPFRGVSYMHINQRLWSVSPGQCCSMRAVYSQSICERSGDNLHVIVLGQYFWKDFNYRDF